MGLSASAKVDEYAGGNEYECAEGKDYPGGVGRFGYRCRGCVFGCRCCGGVVVCHGVKSVISGYGVEYLLAAVGQSAADGSDSDGFVEGCGIDGGVGGVSLYRYFERIEVKTDVPHGGVGFECAE